MLAGALVDRYIPGIDSTARQEIVRLLTDPDAVCVGQSPHCAVFPEACTVSIEIEIVVNGKPRTVLLGSFLSTVAPHPKHVEMSRLHAGRACVRRMIEGELAILGQKNHAHAAGPQEPL